MSRSGEHYLGDQGFSDTAATIGKPLYGPSGAMSYRVTVVGGMGHVFADIVAASGDDAAEIAHKRYPGNKVTHIEPTPQDAVAA
jgi:hypothetical protein